MLTIAASEKFVLTLQSIPPFLVESILAFALAVLLAVPLIARLQFLFDNRDSCAKPPDPINNPSKRLRHHSRHIIMKYPSSMITTSHSNQSIQLNGNNSFRDLKQSLKSSTSVPFTDQSQDLVENGTHENEEENDEETMSDDNPIMNNTDYEYKHYRDKLIKENLKKQYGHRQPPGNFIFNSIHLSSIDSQKGITPSDKFNQTLSNFVEPVDLNDKIYTSRQVEDIDQRIYFFTKKSNEKLETVEKGIETVRSSAQVDKLSKMIGMKEHTSPFTGTHRNLRPQRTKKEKLSNDNSDIAIISKIESAEIRSQPSIKKEKLLNDKSDSDNAILSKIKSAEINLQPSTKKEKILNDNSDSDNAIMSKIKSAEINLQPSTKKEKNLNDNSDSDSAIMSKIESAEINSQPSSRKTVIERSFNRSTTPRSPLKPKEPMETEVLIEFNPSPAHKPAENPSDIPEQIQGELNDSKNSSSIVEASVAVTTVKNEKPPSHVSSVIGKCSSMASNEVFSTSSSKNTERRPMNTRPGSSSGGGALRPFKNLLPRVNSRPRSSGALPDWDVPEVKDCIPPHEKLIETKIMTSSAKRPKSANTAVNNKKSEVLSVLESIMDLSCEATIDFQESTVDIDIKKFREMSDDIELTNTMKKNVRRQLEGNSHVMSAASVKKTKLPIFLSNQKRTKSNLKSPIENKETKSFLLARSGNYNSSAITGQNKKKNNN